jgi:hypothetical protein
MSIAIQCGAGAPYSSAATGAKVVSGERRRSLRLLTMATLLVALAGCGAHVTDLSSSAAGSAVPSEILVAVVSDEPGPQGPADMVADKIQSAIVDRLTQAHITAEPYVAGTTHAGAAVLRVTVVQADPGNLAERFIIGFGVGKAKLAVRADLIVADRPAGSSILAFNASADSGVKPGLVLPGAVALGTGRLIGLAIGGGVDVAANIRGGLDRPEKSAATAVVKQLKTYYATAGWYWPTA